MLNTLDLFKMLLFQDENDMVLLSPPFGGRMFIPPGGVATWQHDNLSVIGRLHNIETETLQCFSFPTCLLEILLGQHPLQTPLLVFLNVIPSYSITSGSFLKHHQRNSSSMTKTLNPLFLKKYIQSLSHYIPIASCIPELYSGFVYNPIDAS
jgi:hypothetical protein